ncbi:hypothetical protein PGT21_014514 [Puccinia graminis f. sp. tritici]|uniref:Uncharacterized protein n=1 Tax=Puccinia graminis f. sp. tritici TaxID=56615 RepID=A0A5B0RW27_PUCGR|nr:hypothetical protein PGT21_014514 [Puccinia graminis f. sp. tritici]KAA1129325.1 hypothetical protein PGTUg99_027407 [Puccinia graminis f. sp. tritici]
MKKSEGSSDTWRHLLHGLTQSPRFPGRSRPERAGLFLSGRLRRRRLPLTYLKVSWNAPQGVGRFAPRNLFNSAPGSGSSEYFSRWPHVSPRQQRPISYTAGAIESFVATFPDSS